MQLEVAVQKQLGAFRLDTAFTIIDHRVGIFGTSGSGKSTLMHLLAGLLKNGGSALFSNIPISSPT